jgi:hypothetical protein
MKTLSTFLRLKAVLIKCRGIVNVNEPGGH